MLPGRKPESHLINVNRAWQPRWRSGDIRPMLVSRTRFLRLHYVAFQPRLPETRRWHATTRRVAAAGVSRPDLPPQSGCANVIEIRNNQDRQE